MKIYTSSLLGSFKTCCMLTSLFLCIVLILPCSFSYASNDEVKIDKQKIAGKSVYKKNKKLAPGSQFYAIVLKLYNSQDPLLRAIAYIDTINIPHTPILDKALRKQLKKKPHEIEQFILLYTLAITTRADKDIEALFDFVFSKGAYILTAPIYAKGWSHVNVRIFLDYYGELVNNSKYQRRAWLCGIASLTFAESFASEEFVQTIRETFPEGMDVPWCFPDDDGTFEYSKDKEATRVTKKEAEWLASFYTDYEKGVEIWSHGKSWEESEALWATFFTSLAPLLDVGGKDLELARLFLLQEFRTSFPEGLYERFYPKDREIIYKDKEPHVNTSHMQNT